MSASLAALLGAPRKRTPLGAMMAFGVQGPVAPADPTLHVLVRCTDTATKSVAGVPLAKGAGDVMTALVPASKLAKFVAAPQVQRVSAPRMMRPLMDIALPLAGVPKYVKKTGMSGKGVIIGIVDTGIDLTHPDFTGRVLKLWDQEIAGPGPGDGLGNFGAVLTGAAMTVSKDVHGHGTHVAGIAGGGGQAYPGVATGAEYLIVKTNFQNSAIVEGVRWIFAEAAKLGRPCVVNLSLGGHYDSHDGMDDTSVAISDECGPGRLVVAAAGNEGGDPIHAAQAVTAASPGSFGILVKPRKSLESAPYFLVNGWYSGKGSCEVRAVSSTGANTAWQKLIATDPAVKTYTLGGDTVTISTPDSAAPNGDRQFVVEVQGNAGPVQGGTWKVEVRRKSGNPGVVHAWLLLHPDRPSSARFAVPVFDSLIGSPGAGLDVVTVASYTSRNTWKDLSGEEESVGLAPDTISEFSSPGPLRGGGLKPDVAAPGAMIASCLSSASAVEQGNVIAKRYRVMAGTSMAAPFVSGLLALLLEGKPQTTPAQAKAWLKKGSSIPNAAAGKHDVKWGYGLIKV
ncbi:S8 family serine peptidase [Pseudoduganella namucuonensis]|nr:S8 family serine peptidase [Pseudoduganella namucuonensis]